MAKRKRLIPADPQAADPARAPETKAMFPLGVAPPTRSRVPIGQVVGDTASAAALEDMSRHLDQARASGRLIQEIPEDQIDEAYLVRDRVFQDEDEMRALMESLHRRGQQTPVELVELGPNRYGLISGWRRLTALRQLLAETGEARFGTVLGMLRQPEGAADAYLAMVEENEIRVGLSYYERARIAARAVEQGVYSNEKAALLTLFPTASRAKRSKIRSFLTIYHALDDTLTFAAAIPERLGLRLAKALESEAGLADRLRKKLAQARSETPAAELSCLTETLGKTTSPTSPPPPQDAEKHISEPGTSRVSLAWSEGDLVLRGDGVTPEFARRLQAWLSSADRSG